MKVAHRLPSTAMSRSASSSRMLGLLPPSSSVTFLIVPAAWRITSRPTSVLPVNAILSTSGFVREFRADDRCPAR